MASNRRYAVGALIASGVLWGATVSLSKVALGWLDPAWLTVGRFLIAGIVLGWIGRRHLRAALSWQAMVAGALGFGACVALQSAGIANTSVSHASVLLGVVPALVAVASRVAGHGNASRREWLSYALSLAGIGLIAGAGGGGATVGGDILVLMSVMLSAVLIAVQPGLLRGQDPAALTAVQFFAAAVFVLPAAFSGVHPLPSAPTSLGPPLAFIALVLAGTVLPFWLFAYGQSQVRPQLAGAFVNLEPVVGAAIGWVLFADPCGPLALLGALAVIAGIVLAATCRTLPLPDMVARAWQGGMDVHRAMLARPWDHGQLHWQGHDDDWQLEGRYLPTEPEPLSTPLREPDPEPEPQV
jgi:O-acetylserine/cysteine efflux transporter